MWWLDAARYSDTDGFQADATRTNWPWRDWVIQSFNANQPFDQFTIEQFAGDLLPDAKPEQILATCFHRNHMTNGEGGRDPEESRVDYVIDRVNTTERSGWDSRWAVASAIPTSSIRSRRPTTTAFRPSSTALRKMARPGMGRSLISSTSRRSSSGRLRKPRRSLKPALPPSRRPASERKRSLSRGWPAGSKPSRRALHRGRS